MGLGLSSLSTLLLGRPFLSDLPASALRAFHIAQFQPSLIEPMDQVACYLLQTILDLPHVLIVTGFPTRWGFETDGPLGALNLASVLSLLNPSVQIGLPSSLYASIQRISSPFPVIGRGSFSFVDLANIETLRNTLLITIEYPGANAKNVCHTMQGLQISPEFTQLNAQIDQSQPKAWVAIGDGGNEIGLGRFRPAVEAVLPYGRTCCCDCQEGIGASHSANHSLLSVTSNFGALGLALELLKQTGHEGEYNWNKEEKMLSLLNAVGILDGVSGAHGTVDGISQVLAHRMLDRLLEHYSDLKRS